MIFLWTLVHIPHTYTVLIPAPSIFSWNKFYCITSLLVSFCWFLFHSEVSGSVPGSMICYLQSTVAASAHSRCFTHVSPLSSFILWHFPLMYSLIWNTVPPHNELSLIPRAFLSATQRLCTCYSLCSKCFYFPLTIFIASEETSPAILI